MGSVYLEACNGLRCMVSNLLRLIILGAVGFYFTPEPVIAAENQTLVLGSGGKGGVYLPAGRAICKYTNATKAKSGLTCNTKTSAGSVTNVRALRAGKAQIGIAQSDVVYDSFQGTADFKKEGPYKDLRVLFALRSEPFTLVVQARSGIQKISDLVGKRVNIGALGSGHRETVDTLSLVKGWKQNTFSETLELAPAAGVKAFCNGQVDAIALTVGHPSQLIKQMTNSCGGRLINTVDEDVGVLIKKLPYYSKVRIPSGLYKDVMRNIGSFGPSANVVASAKISDKTAYWIVKSVFENFDKFKNSHQALKYLDKKEMVSNSLSGLLHPGALSYFKEVGLK